MANILYNGAEFESIDAFNAALQQYCQNTKVNGEAVKFVYSNYDFIKGDVNYKTRLIYEVKTERCEFHGKTNCNARYTLKRHENDNGYHVLRLEEFHGAHNSHIDIVQELLEPAPNQGNLQEVYANHHDFYMEMLNLDEQTSGKSNNK